MTEDRIEREIVIAAAPERVWPLVLEPGFWASDDESIRGTAAAEGKSLVARHSQHGEFPICVEKVDPRRNVIKDHTGGWAHCLALVNARAA